MYWVRAPPVHDVISAGIDMIAIDYELLHRRLEHPSKVVLRAAHKHVKNFPSVTIPPVEPVCSGCQLGKQPNYPFAVNKSRATKPFELIHSDLKSFKSKSYHRSRYIIIFYDDYTNVFLCFLVQSVMFCAFSHQNTCDWDLDIRGDYVSSVSGAESITSMTFSPSSLFLIIESHQHHLFQNQLFKMSFSNFISCVPYFNGPNYQQWAPLITGYLHTIGA